MCTSDIFLGLLAILFPPLAVWVKRGICSVDSLINIALCCLGFIPGLLHAWYIIARYPEESDYVQLNPDPENRGGITYYYVSNRPVMPNQSQQPPQEQRNYGTVAPATRRPADLESGLASAPAAGPSSGEGVGDGVPPSYADAVKGDNKVQRHD
ncbi:MAG: hypothetical protein M1824_001613 [Vezdaea acicularis]|nr:MAG: hypothetical protein M1824_001613 [Vezdaea acicularis]